MVCFPSPVSQRMSRILGKWSGSCRVFISGPIPREKSRSQRTEFQVSQIKVCLLVDEVQPFVLTLEDEELKQDKKLSPNGQEPRPNGRDLRPNRPPWQHYSLAHLVQHGHNSI